MRFQAECISYYNKSFTTGHLTGISDETVGAMFSFITPRSLSRLFMIVAIIGVWVVYAVLVTRLKHVAWSDESHFQLIRADGRVRVWRPPHESMDPTCQQGTVQAGGGPVMVWGLCSWRDMGPPDAYRYDSYRHFRWPPKFPDMNIIEHIRDALQLFVQKRSPPPLTLTDLWTALQDSWFQLLPALLQTLIECMSRRVVTFLRARSDPTQY
ncbi:transposable element Tcb2 transposase [Trichonephila clavipes]|nr:transposable element Tcb2 transposase [Trichonephila clavipes]